MHYFCIQAENRLVAFLKEESPGNAERHTF